jgi:acetyl esterase/lipase
MVLDAGAQRVIDLIIENERPQFETLSVAEAREAYRASRAALQPDPRPIAEVRNLEANGPAGPIPLRFYRDQPARGAGQPVLVFYHGGGWVIGDLDSHDGVCREIAHRAGMTVIAVDYRLAPEHPFPAAVDDALAALTWVVDNAATLGVDPAKVSVGGDSAGGNLAAVVALLANEAGKPRLASQVLIYPVTDLRMKHASHARLVEQLPIPRTTLEWFYELYVPDRAQHVDWRASPVLADAALFKGLPPALLITAGYDPLGDEGLELGELISAGGAEVENARFDGQIHGFLTMSRLIDEAYDAFDRIAVFLKRHNG